MIDVNEFVQMTEEKDKDNLFKLGTVVGLFSNGTAQILFDGEDQPSEKEYAYLASYIPFRDDRVMLARVSKTYVILGKVNYSVEPEKKEEYFTKSGGTLRTSYGIQATGRIDGASLLTRRIEHRNGGAIGFFGQTPTTTKHTVRTVGQSPTVENLATSLNDLLRALDNYGLIRAF